MSRHRDLAASPVRTAAETWEAIAELVAVTLDPSTTMDVEDVRRTFDAVAPAGLALVAAGHLDRMPLTVIAPPLHLTIGTVTGEAAFRALEDENLNPVPGAATADSWMLYLPRPAGLAGLVDEVAKGVSGVSTAEPPAASAIGAPRSATTVELRRLDPEQRS